MSGMFSCCCSLTALNLSYFNTNNVKVMRYMFYDSHSLISLNLSNFNTNNVKDMSRMFRDCSSLISLNLSSFINVTDINYMFASFYFEIIDIEHI